MPDPDVEVVFKYWRTRLTVFQVRSLPVIKQKKRLGGGGSPPHNLFSPPSFPFFLFFSLPPFINGQPCSVKMSEEYLLPGWMWMSSLEGCCPGNKRASHITAAANSVLLLPHVPSNTTCRRPQPLPHPLQCICTTLRVRQSDRGALALCVG